MNRYDRRKLVENLILLGHAKCVRCGADISEEYNTLDILLDNVDTPRVNKMLPRNKNNCRLQHKNCSGPIEKMVEIFQRGLEWQNCLICKRSVVDDAMNDTSRLRIHSAFGQEYVIHSHCLVR